MKTIKEKILHYLSLNEFAKRKQLLKFLYISGYEISDRELRKTVADLVNADGFCIASTQNGWHLARTRKDIEAHKKYIKAYIKRLSRRVRNMDRNYLRATAKLIPS